MNIKDMRVTWQEWGPLFSARSRGVIGKSRCIITDSEAGRVVLSRIPRLGVFELRIEGPIGDTMFGRWSLGEVDNAIAMFAHVARGTE